MKTYRISIIVVGVLFLILLLMLAIVHSMDSNLRKKTIKCLGCRNESEWSLLAERINRSTDLETLNDVLLVEGFRSIPVDYSHMLWNRSDSDRLVVIIGDSMVYGQGVETDETFPTALQLILQERCETPILIVNLGIVGASTREESIMYSHIGILFKPDLVILGIYENDWRESYLGDCPLDIIKVPLQWKLAKSRFAWSNGLARRLQASRESCIFKTYSPEMKWAKIREPLSSLLDVVPTEKMLIVGEFENPRPDYDWGDLMHSFLTKKSVSFVSLENLYKKHDTLGLTIPNDGHPTPIAHSLIAMEIADALTGANGSFADCVG